MVLCHPIKVMGLSCSYKLSIDRNMAHTCVYEKLAMVSVFFKGIYF